MSATAQTDIYNRSKKEKYKKQDNQTLKEYKKSTTYRLIKVRLQDHKTTPAGSLSQCDVWEGHWNISLSWRVKDTLEQAYDLWEKGDTRG